MTDPATAVDEAQAKQNGPINIHPDYLYSIKDVSKVVGKSIPSIYRLLKQNKFPVPVRIGGSPRWHGRRLLELFETGK